MIIKIILVIYIAYNLTNKIKAYNQIFITKTYEEDVNDVLDELKYSKSKFFEDNIFKGIITITYSLPVFFYILSAIVINNIIFSVVSLMFIIESLKNIKLVLDMIESGNYNKDIETYDKIKLFIDIGYNIFVFINII